MVGLYGDSSGLRILFFYAMIARAKMILIYLLQVR